MYSDKLFIKMVKALILSKTYWLLYKTKRLINVLIILAYFVCPCVQTVKRTHLDASSTSVALMLKPSPASKVVSLPTTTTPPFIVPKAGRQRRVTVEGGDDPFTSTCFSFTQ